jgi:hypothetical protein
VKNKQWNLWNFLPSKFPRRNVGPVSLQGFFSKNIESEKFE